MLFLEVPDIYFCAFCLYIYYNSIEYNVGVTQAPDMFVPSSQCGIMKVIYFFYQKVPDKCTTEVYKEV